MSILVVDVGTSGLRAAIVRPDATVEHVHHRPLPPQTPFQGLVEFDARTMADAVLDVAGKALADAGPVEAVGIADQRASTIVWDRATGEPVGPGLGWQDLRTVGECLTLAGEHGLRFAPNQSATKLAWLLNTFDPGRTRDLCFGTVDSWVTWVLSNGSLHVTDVTNAGLTGLVAVETETWVPRTLDLLAIPAAMLPRVVDTSGVVGHADALPGAPPIAALVGDQQGSLVGQGCVQPGMAKITFGTGGMLDVCTGDDPPVSAARSANGSFPIFAWRKQGATTYGAEALMLSAGTNVEWLCDDLGLIDTPAASHEVAQRCDDSGGVVYVPALLGLGTPAWDYGARGGLFGLTRGSEAPQIVRAVLEGVAHRGADLVEAVEADTGLSIDSLRIDGGMSVNPTFVQAVADAAQRPVEVSPIPAATTLGAAFLAGLAVGTWSSLDDVAAAWHPSARAEPRRVLDRERWREAVDRSRRWIPELSALDF